MQRIQVRELGSGAAVEFGQNFVGRPAGWGRACNYVSEVFGSKHSGCHKVNHFGDGFLCLRRLFVGGEIGAEAQIATSDDIAKVVGHIGERLDENIVSDGENPLVKPPVDVDGPAWAETWFVLEG